MMVMEKNGEWKLIFKKILNLAVFKWLNGWIVKERLEGSGLF